MKKEEEKEKEEKEEEEKKNWCVENGTYPKSSENHNEKHRNSAGENCF